MSQDTTNDLLNYDDNRNQAKLPTGLNVLTVLSFIGCGIQLLSSLWTFFSSKSSFENKDKLMEQINSNAMPAWAKSMMGDPAHLEEMITKSYENRVPIVLLSLVAVALCFMGVMQMRKLKKQGFVLYIIGELLPFVSLFLFIGAFTFSGFSFFIGVGISLLFIFLYFMQKKNLVH